MYSLTEQTLMKAEPSDSGPSPADSTTGAENADLMPYSLSLPEEEQLWDICKAETNILPTEVMDTEQKAEDVIDLTDEAVEVFSNVRFSHKKKKKKKRKRDGESLCDHASDLKTFCSIDSVENEELHEEFKLEVGEKGCQKDEVDDFIIVQNPDYDEGEMETKHFIDAAATGLEGPKRSTRRRAVINYSEDILNVTWPVSRQVRSTSVSVDSDLVTEKTDSNQESLACHKCSQCDRTFMSDMGLKRHVQMKHSARALEMKSKYGCEYCNELFSTQTAKIRHKRKHVGPVYKAVNAGNTPLKTVACTLCEKKYASEEHLRNHEKIHSEGLRFGCDDCGQAFSVLSRLNEHLCQSHGLVRFCPFTCPVPECDGKAFSSRQRLRTHERSHTKTVSHECPYCGRSFSERGNMRRHMKIHLGIKDHRCSHCGKNFSEKTSLQGHVRMVHTGERPFPCQTCQKAFATRSDLRRHQLKHSSVCKHKCPNCGKAYKSRSALKQHRRQESGENRWQCGECGKRFASKGNLKVHMHVHSSIKRFECGVCKKSFPLMKTLVTHLRVHTGDKPYTCSRCEKRFSCASNKTRHEKTVHEM